MRAAGEEAVGLIRISDESFADLCFAPWPRAWGTFVDRRTIKDVHILWQSGLELHTEWICPGLPGGEKCAAHSCLQAAFSATLRRWLVKEWQYSPSNRMVGISVSRLCLRRDLSISCVLSGARSTCQRQPYGTKRSRSLKRMFQRGVARTLPFRTLAPIEFCSKMQPFIDTLRDLPLMLSCIRSPRTPMLLSLARPRYPTKCPCSFESYEGVLALFKGFMPSSGHVEQ